MCREELSGQQVSKEGEGEYDGTFHRMNKEEMEDDCDSDDSDDEEDPFDLAEGLQGIDSDKADEIWDNSKEEKQFDELVKSGDLASVLPSSFLVEVKIEVQPKIRDSKVILKMRVIKKAVQKLLKMQPRLLNGHPKSAICLCLHSQVFSGDYKDEFASLWRLFHSCWP